MELNLLATPLFNGINQNDLQTLLKCLNAVKKEYKKGSTILQEGTSVEQIGLVLEGMVLITHSDVWGNTHILNSLTLGDVFGESYALSRQQVLLVNVKAVEDTKILFLDVSHLIRTCGTSCQFHHQIIQNLLEISSSKNIQLSRRIFYTSAKSIRARLMAYFSDCVKNNNRYLFQIPFDRQQLADYLSVDRSALSNELSKMQKDGLIEYEKNTFKILTKKL